MTDIKIGDTFYVFDENRRVYDKTKPNHGPIYREHFKPEEITGETSRSWLVGHWKTKVPKKDPWSVLNTQQMVDDKCWQHEHQYKISELVRNQWRTDINTLRQIAKLIEYEE